MSSKRKKGKKKNLINPTLRIHFLFLEHIAAEVISSLDTLPATAVSEVTQKAERAD